FADPAHADAGTGARPRDREEHRAQFRRGSAGGTGVALPCAAPADQTGMDRGGRGRVRKQPESEVLPADAEGAETASSGDIEMGENGARDCGNPEPGRGGSETVKLRRRVACDIENDIREHIEIETRENIGRGMAPDEALRTAMRRFGNPVRIAEETRAVWRPEWLTRVRQDASYAVRGL